MKQALHIFKKDFRYLRLEICLVLLLSMVFAWIETHSRNPGWVELLLMIGAGYLIARLIHAEAIPGDSQFWITRPYRWNSLLGAKLLFILTFVNLPIFAARLLVLIAGDFPLMSSLPGLLWSQLLMMIAVSLPIAALATVTTGIVPFTFSALILLTIGFGVQEITVPPSLPAVRFLLGPVQWVWDAIAVFALVAIAVPILYIQYRKRRTLFSRTFGLGVAALGVAAYLYVPWPLALALQTQLSKRSFDISSVHIALDPKSSGVFKLGKLPGIPVDLPLEVLGIPDSMDVEADGLAVTFEGSDGRTWKSGAYDFPALPRNRSRLGVTIFNGIVVMDPAFFNAEREQTVTLRASLYMTLFGNSRAKTIPIQNTPVNVMDGLQCYLGVFNQLYCRSAFRWPALLVYAKFGDSAMNSFTHSISYSPIPAGLSFDSVEVHHVSAPTSARQVTIISKEPLENIRCDFKISGIRLVDFASVGK